MKQDNAFLLTILFLLLVLSVVLILPYIQFILGAVLLAFVLQPLHRRLVQHISATFSAAILVIFSSITFLVPLIVIIALIAGDVMDFIENIEGGAIQFETVEQEIESVIGIDIELTELARSGAEQIGESVLGNVLTAFEATIHFIIGIGLLLFLLFFLIRDGGRLVDWIQEMSPLPSTVVAELRVRLAAITKAVLMGHVLVAIIQGLIAGIGLAVVGIPNYVFWTFVMILLALIPLIGTFVVWAPASLYLILGDQLVPGIGLFIYGLLVVGISDEYLRPIIVERYAEINAALIILGVIGGLTVFGFMGLFYGPILVGALKEVTEVYHEHYGHLNPEASE